MSVSREDDAEPGRFEVRTGEQVRLLVETDVPLALELDGEPVRADPRPGEPAEIGFDAPEPGRYELRDGRSDSLIATIDVRP